MRLSSYTNLRFETHAAWTAAKLAAVTLFGSLYRLSQSTLPSLNISESTLWLVLYDIQAQSRQDQFGTRTHSRHDITSAQGEILSRPQHLCLS